MSKEVVNVQMEREFYDKVMTNVAGSGSASSYKYYLIGSDLGGAIHLMSSIIKIHLDGETIIAPTASSVLELRDEVYNKDIVKAFGVDLNQKLYVDGQWTTVGGVVRPSSYFTEITEEEFYNLNA